MSTTHSTTVHQVPAGYLARCGCGWRAAFPSFSEQIARGHAVRHYIARGGSDDDDSRELIGGTAEPTALALLSTAEILAELRSRGLTDEDIARRVGCSVDALGGAL